MAKKRFVELGVDKRAWSPSPFPGQVVLVTTRGPDGAVDIAPKSWVSMAAFAGPVVGFGCNTEHATLKNLVVSREFVVNVPGVGLAERVWRMLDSHGRERVTRSGLTLRSARTVAAPAIEECCAYAECRVRDVVEFDEGEVFIFGTVTAIAVDAAALDGGPATRYAALAPFFFAEDGWYAPLGRARDINGG